jgi:hypothetical protein
MGIVLIISCYKITIIVAGFCFKLQMLNPTTMKTTRF